MKNTSSAKKMLQNNQGATTSDRTNHSVKNDKKQVGITNGGGQRSDQTSNKDNARKREHK